MFCMQCGGEVPAGSRFCPRCGRVATGPDGGPSGGPPSAPTPGPPMMPPPPPAPSFGSGPAPSYGPPPGTYPPPPPGAFPGGAGGPVSYGLATFGQRVGGFLIDGAIMSAIYIFGIIVAVMTTPTETFDNPDPSPNGLGILVMLLSWIGAVVYPIFFEGRPEGQTLGKKALGIRVVRQANGAPLGYALAIGRFFARFADSFTFGVGLLWAAWDPMHQTFHDKIAGTLVVRSSVYPPPGSTPPGYPQAQPFPYGAG